MPALRFRLAFVTLFVIAAVACAGGRNGVVPRGELSRSAQTVGSLATSWTGTITSMITNQFNLHNPSCGYVHVMTSSATQIFPSGAKLAVGENVTVTGTGSCSTSITAATVTVNGTTTPMPSGSPSPTVKPSATPTSTPTPKSTPSASPTPTSTPSTTPTPSGGVPPHVMTADYMYTSHGFAYSAYTSSLTWGEANTFTAPYNGTQLSQAGIKVMAYTDPNRVEPGEPLWNNYEDTFAHDCNGNRITSKARTNQYLMDPHSSRLTQLWQNWAANLAAQTHYDALFDDDADNFYNLTALPCNYAEPDWFNTTEAQMQQIPHPFIYNALSVLGPNNTVSPKIAFNSVSIGGVMEDCYGSVFHPHFVGSPTWEAVEDTEITMANDQKLFFCYESMQDQASTAQVARIWVYASFMLTYDPATSVLWEYFATPSGYHVQPETQLVPTQPLVVKVSEISTTHFSGGSYAREYAACYIAGKNVGPCAAIVNPDAYPHPYPALSMRYTHTIVLNGGGILDGGTIATNGPPPASSLQPTTGMIVFK